MKLKEYLRYLVEDEPVTIIDAESDEYWRDKVKDKLKLKEIVK